MKSRALSVDILILLNSVRTQSLPACYAESNPDRFFKYATVYQIPANVAGRTGECSRACGIESYTYGGEWNKTACFCGNNLPATTIIDAQCSSKKQIYVNQVTQMPVTRITPIEITTELTQILNTDAAKLNVKVPNTLGSSLLYYIYFGDVIGYKEQIAAIDQPITVQYTKTASSWVNIEAKTAAGIVMSSGGLTLQVIERLVTEDVTFTCPQMAFQEAEIECTVQSTTGSHLLGSIQFGSGTFERFTVPESGWEMMHPSASRFTESTTACPDATLIIPGTSARYTGLLSEINLHAAISGSFKLLHLRVKCSTDKYNYDQNVCTKVDSSLDCLYATSNKVFSMDVQDCVSPTLTGCENQLRRLKLDVSSTVEPYDYEVVEVVNVNMTTVGWQRVPFSGSPWSIQPGDRLGLLVTKPIPIACALPSTYQPNDLITTTITSVTVGYTIDHSRLSRSGVRFQLGSWTKIVHKTVLSGTISQIGDAMILLSLSTFENGLNEVVANQTISIVSALSTDGLEKTELKTNVATTLRLTNVGGKPNNFNWNFGDGSPEEKTTTGEIIHTYTKSGDYKLTVNMSNVVGFIVIQENVVVRDELVFSRINVNLATVGLPTTLVLDLIDGPGLTCTWKIQAAIVHVGPEKSYTHTYDRPGEFSVSVTCTNVVFTVQHNVTQEAYERIDGLTTESNSVSIGPAQPLVFNFLHGSNLTVDLKVDGQFKTVQIDYVHRKIISEALSVSAPVEMPYVVNVSNTLGWQEISGTVRFDEPMEGLSVTFEPPVSTVNADVKFNVAFRRGTSIELQIDFNDTNVYNEPVNKLQNWPQGYQKTHRYAKAGTYVVKLSASGGSKQDVVQVTVSVQGPLGTYILEPANSYTGRNDLFALLVNRVAGDIAVMTQIGIDWGDTLAPFSDRFIEGKKIGHVYTSTGDFTITVTLTMNTSVKKYTTLVSVREPIRNFGCSLLTNPIKFGDKVSVAVSVRDGEQVTITAQFEVGQPAQILQQNIAEPVVLDYTYLTTGQHNISIKAANVVGTKTCLLNADVRKPISNMYFEFPPLLENYAGETSVLIRYMGTTVDFPAGLSYVVDWGDSSPLEVGSLDKPFVKHKIEHVLTRLSYFQVSARLDNQVSRYETTSKVGVFGRIGYIRLQITVAATGEIGYGEKHDRFAAGNPLKLMILSDGRPDNVAETLFEILDLTSGKNTSLTWAESNYQLFTFTKQGQMRIFAEGRNPFSHAFTSMDIYIGSDLRGLRGELVNASVLSPQKTGLFRVFFEAISESSCICVEKEDQTGPIVFPAKDQHAKDCISCPTFNSVYKRPINNTLDIQLNYPTSGEKQLKITAQNPSAQIMRSFTVTVSQLECDPPQIWFIEDSIKSPSSPLTVESNKPVTVGANITGNICTLNGQNTIRWSVFELDVDTLNPIRQVNVSDQPSARSSELLLPANHLKPGFYIATIRVNLSVAPGAPTVSSQADAYIYSVYPPLMIQLYEGNPESVDVGLAQETICLNPQKYSYDPAITDKSEPQVSQTEHEPSQQQGIVNWTWYCAKAGEQLTENLVAPKPQGHVFGGSRTGCFGDGPGRIAVHSGQLCFWSGNFEPKTRYKIKVIGFKSQNRMGSAITTLNCDTQAAPLVYLKCTLPEQCKPSNSESIAQAAWAISSTEDLYFTSTTESFWTGISLTYTWELKYIYARGDGSFLSTNQMEIYTEGFSTPTLRVKKQFFTADNAAIGIKVCAAVIINGSTGIACLRAVFLEPPVTGKCTTDNETSSRNDNNNNNTVCVTCTGFSSKYSKRLDYTFYLKTSPRTVLVVGHDPLMCAQIPPSGNAFPYCVQASDQHGSTDEVCFGTAKIDPPKPEEIENILNSLLDQNSSRMNTLQLTGNLNTKANIVANYAEIVLQQNSLDKAHEQSGGETTVEMEEKRNNRSEAISKLVGVVSTMVPNTADSMIMTSATVNAVLKNREDMDRQSQSRLTEMLGGYAVSLPIVLAQHDITKRQEVIAQVVDNAVHLVGISVSQKNDSVPKDIERNPKLLDYNVDLEGPGLKGSEDIWRELSLQNSAADQSKVASSASNVLASLLQTHSGLLQTTLIEDNTPTVTTTSSAVLGLHKLGSAKNISVTMPANKHGSSATVPDLCSTVQKIGIDCHLPLTVQSLTSDFNMFAFVNPASSSIPVPPECNTVTLSIYNDTNQISLENTDKPFEILLRKSPRFVPPAFAALDESAKDAKLPASRIAADNSIVYQALLVSEITLPDSNSGVTFQLMPRNLSGCPQYLVVGRMIEPPVISRVGGKFDFWGTIPMDTKQCDQMQVDPDELNYPYTFFVNNTQLTKAKSTAISALGDRKLSPEALQKVYVGFRELNDQERNKYNPDNPPPMPYPFRDQINSTATSRIFISSCMSTNTERPTSWSSAGCDVGPETTVKQTQCFCYHLSTFAAGYLHSPNKLDFDYIFANMDFEKNPTLYGTEIAIFLLFLPLFIWARRKDVKDMEKLGVTPLAENNPNDDYLYEIIVSTGRRRGAGTDSKVCFMLSGEYGETEAKVLADPCRKVLQRGNCDRFLLACPRPLGKLIYCRLWHDNSGKDDRASWYCNYLGVVDLQTREKSHFIVGRWFAVDEEDGQMTLLPITLEDTCLLAHLQLANAFCDVVLLSAVFMCYYGSAIFRFLIGAWFLVSVAYSWIACHQFRYNCRLHHHWEESSEVRLCGYDYVKVSHVRRNFSFYLTLKKSWILTYCDSIASFLSGLSLVRQPVAFWHSPVIIRFFLQKMSVYTYLRSVKLCFPIDRLIPVSNQEEMMALSHMFATSISRDLSDEHLWVSVVARPASSRFTRVERVACCLLLLFLSMLSSCMFYQKEGAIKQPDLFTMGPFAFTAQEMFVAVINNLITFVPLFVVTYLFRNSRLYTSHAKLLREAVERHLDETIDIGQCSIGLDEKKASDKRVRFASSDGGSSATEITVSNKRKGSRSCPWQMRILTWIILILSLATAATFTTFYGVSFGNAACQKWLSSMFLSFFTSLLLVQPLKVVLLAVFLSLMCKRMDRVDEIDILEEENALIYELGKRYQLQMDEEYLHNEYLMSNFKPKRMVILPPDPDALDKIRIYRMKQRRANDIIREIFFYVIFLCLLFTVTLEFRDPFGFPLRQNIEDSFFGDDFTKMHSVDDFYAWINYTLIPKLRAKRWYNQGPPVFQRGFLEDRVNRIIGYGLMRQLRVKPNSCNVYSSAKPLIKNCYDTYDMFTQDEQAYGVGWIPFQGDSRHNNSMREFQYTSTSVLGGVPYRGKMGWYSGGGYVHMFRGSEEEMLNNLHFLRSKHWIEFGTRAIIVQFTAYNPNVNLFAIVTALVELPGLGTVIPSHRIETANLFGTAGSHVTTVEIGFQVYLIIFTLILTIYEPVDASEDTVLTRQFCDKVAYVVALLGYMFKEAHNLYKQRCQYFKDIWNFVELFIMFGSFAAIAAYAYMIFATKEAIAEFSRTHGNVFMNFQFLAYWNETLTYLLAVICFFATLKLVRLFRFNRRIGLLGSVLRYAARDLKYFMIIFFLLFIAFVLVFYLLYEGTLADFRSFLGSVETSLQIILGKFDFTSMYERELVLGPLMFAVFTLCIIFIVVSMFVAILEESFGKVMQDIRLQSDDHEITQFILAQLIAWSGLNRTGWGKKLMGPIDTAQEPVYQEHSERELSHKLTELNRLMDEFLGYVQLNYLADLDTKSKKPATEM